MRKNRIGMKPFFTGNYIGRNKKRPSYGWNLMTLNKNFEGDGQRNKTSWTTTTCRSRRRGGSEVPIEADYGQASGAVKARCVFKTTKLSETNQVNCLTFVFACISCWMLIFPIRPWSWNWLMWLRERKWHFDKKGKQTQQLNSRSVSLAKKPLKRTNNCHLMTIPFRAYPTTIAPLTTTLIRSLVLT